MTNKHTLLALSFVSLLGCSTDVPEKTFDFSARPLTGAIAAPTVARSPKGQMRRAIDMLQPRLARCTERTSGDLDVTLRLALTLDRAPLLDDVTVSYPDRAAASCVREVLASIDLSGVEARESSVWVVHMPFSVAAYSEAK